MILCKKIKFSKTVDASEKTYNYGHEIKEVVESSLTIIGVVAFIDILDTRAHNVFGVPAFPSRFQFNVITFSPYLLGLFHTVFYTRIPYIVILPNANYNNKATMVFYSVYSGLKVRRTRFRVICPRSNAQYPRLLVYFCT